jgi:transposase
MVVIGVGTFLLFLGETVGTAQELPTGTIGLSGRAKCERIRLAVMDMWKPFRNATNAHAPQAAILFDKFHIIRHLGEALDQVRKSEYARLSGKQRRFIKGKNTRCCRARRTSRWRADRHRGPCCAPTNG